MCSKRLRIADCGLVRNGFSLVEIMVVIVIIGLLSGVVTVSVRSYMTKAKQQIARDEIRVIVGAVESFWSERSRYPTNDEGIAVLCTKSDKSPDPYLSKEPVDPWGHSYVYNCPGSKGPYEVICLGADGREGGDGADSDISSDELTQKATK
ncbi:MAG: type II secretion system major pseudopilin GspG [Phycisphaerae bacterium]